MNIAYITRDNIDLKKALYMKEQVDKMSSKTKMIIITGEREHFDNQHPDVFYVFKNYQDYYNKSKALSKKELSKKIIEYYNYIDITLYQSDARYYSGIHKKKDLAIEQLFLCEMLVDFYKLKEIKLTFMAGGGNLIRNVPFDISRSLNVPSYRILNRKFLNPNRKDYRYWFCSGNFSEVSTKDSVDFDYDKDLLSNHVSQLIKSIQDRTYRLDQHAIQNAKPKRIITSPKRLIKDILILTFKYKNYNQARDRLSSLLNRHLNKLVQSNPDMEDNIILFPLNTPLDAQITLRSPQYKDQLALSSLLAGMIPYGYTLYIKEHPGHPGMFNTRELRSLLKKHNNIKFISSDFPINPIIKKCDALVVINSTSALEAMIMNKPVVTLGEAFYRDQKVTYDLESLKDFRKLLVKAIAETSTRKSGETNRNINNFLFNILNQTVPAPLISSESLENKNPTEAQLDLIAQGIIQIAKKKN